MPGTTPRNFGIKKQRTMRTKKHFSILPALAIVFLANISAKGQGTCADLNITSLTYAAFNDSSIEVIAHTNPGTFFSYPTFALVDASGEALTYENVNFFGITSTDQTHSSFLIDGQEMPTSPFTGTLIFTYAGLDDMDTCIYPIDASLCPPAPCSPLSVYFYNTGSGVNATFDWTMTEDGGTEVGNGTLTLNTATATDADSLCLPPGNYTLHMEQTSGPAGAYQYGVSRWQPFFEGPHSVFFQSQPNDLPFVFYELCLEGTNGIGTLAEQAPSITVADRRLTLTSADGSAIGQVEVLDASGRIIHQARTDENRTTIDLHTQPVGVFVVRTSSGASNTAVSTTQRIILF